MFYFIGSSILNFLKGHMQCCGKAVKRDLLFFFIKCLNLLQISLIRPFFKKERKRERQVRSWRTELLLQEAIFPPQHLSAYPICYQLPCVYP